jgi:predicted GNAT family acetyltransferase
LNFVKFDEVKSFKEFALSLLEKNEVLNNLPLGILLNTKEEDQPILMGAITKEEDILFLFLQTIPQQVILSKIRDVSEIELKEVAQILVSEELVIPGMVGERMSTLSIVIKMEKIIKQSVNQRLYKLEKVKKRPSEHGILRQVRKDEVALIKDWIYQFCIDIHEPISIEQAEEKTKSMIGKESLYGWEKDGELVSTANVARPTKTNATVNSVYTPLSKRRKGYASDCVSALTQHLLDRGYATTSLYTDLDNPTSNKIYMEIGYVPIEDWISVRFV